MEYYFKVFIEVEKNEGEMVKVKVGNGLNICNLPF